MAFDTEVVDDSVATDATETEAQETATDDAQNDHEPEQVDAEQQEAETAETESKPEKKSRASDRIQELVAKNKAYEAELSQLRQQSQQPQAPKQQNVDGAPIKPNMDDYDLDTELDEYFEAQAKYEEALDEWKFDQRLKQREQARVNEQRQQQTMQDFQQAFEADPDFKANFANLQQWIDDKPVTADPSQLYQGKDLMDVLATIAADADLYYELADMTETQQYARYGQIHAQIQARKQQPNAVKKSNAPRPATHTKPNASIARDPYSASDDEFLEARGL